MRPSIAPKRHLTPFGCGHCGSEHLQIRGFVNDEHGEFAAYHAYLYDHDDHDDVHEAYVDVVMDDDWEKSDPLDPGPGRTTFGCRIGLSEGPPAPACSLLQAAMFHEGEPFFGDRLDRDRALTHPWLPLFWETIEHLLRHEPDLNAHLYRTNAPPR